MKNRNSGVFLCQEGVMQMQINKLPMDYKKNVVAMLVDGEFWYWGSWDDKSKAE